MAPSVLQNGGFFLGLIGAAALIAATATNAWSVKDRQGDIVTSIYTYKGLWRDCETTSSGLTECHPLYGLLGFSGVFQAVRALMIVGVVLSTTAAVMSLFSLTCITMNSVNDSTKAKMSIGAGIMFIISGFCGIVGASIYANQIVASFRMSTYNYGGEGIMEGEMGMGMGMGMGGGMAGIPRYTFGPALFVAWIGGSVLIVGGILELLAFREMMKDERARYPGVAYKPQSHTRTEPDDRHSEGGKNYM
ncbi:claudin-18-like [Solea senegalensis]|uniref:Claudin n=1 Tax=Solea senegalensis TaxID=28829 RepID=A0AAV6TA73_SOLSE|nr:claudin-18 [Solea senegalensis]KAG7526435.1 claudin-18-like [Solea senegalensis]